MKRILALLAAVVGFAVLQAQAEVITMDDANFARLYNDTQNGSGKYAIYQGLSVGTKSNANGWDLHAGLCFQMTGGSAADLEAANFSVSVDGGQGTPIYNVDVYVNRISSSTNFAISDFENGTKIMDDFVTTDDGLALQNYSLDATGQANLLTYLENNWVENDYVFLTLKLNTDDNNFIAGEDVNANYKFGGGTTYSADATDAQLTVTIPEPATLGMVAAFGGGILLIRRLQMG